MLLASTAEAATYYVKPDGDNTAAGTSWATAWKHPNKLNTAVAYGDVIYFAPARYDTVALIPTVGGLTLRCAESYDDADSGRVSTILSSGLELTNNFTLRSGSIYRYDVTISPRWNTIVADGRMAVTEDDSVLMSCTSLGAVDAAGKYFYDASTDSLFVWSFGSDDPDLHTLRFSQRPVVELKNSTNNITFYGLTLDMGYQATVILTYSESALLASDSITIYGCIVQNTSGYGGGVNPALIYSGNTSGGTPDSAAEWSQRNLFRKNILRHSKANSSDYSGGAAFDFYAVQKSLIDSNNIWDCYGGPFMLKYGSSGAEKADSLIIAFNYCVGGRASVWASGRMKNLLVYGNTFIGATTYALDIHSTSVNGSYEGIKFWNNTFFNGGSSYSMIISPEAAGACEFKYNIDVDTISTIARTLWWKVQGGEAPTQSPLTCTYWTVDSNMYYFGGSSFACEFDVTACNHTGTNFAAWQAAGFDVNGSATTNPNFASSGTYDLSRPSASGEMNRTYGGRTWTIYGAIQPSDACPDTLVAPVFQSPANGATGQTNSVILDWSDSTQAGTVDAYDLEVDDNSSFASPVFSSTTTYSKDTVFVALQYSTTYYWRVRGYSDCDTSAWSGYRSFVMRAWPMFQDTCLQITEKVNLTNSDTCYCVSDSLIYTFAQWDTLINTNGKDNIRIWGYRTAGGRGIIGYSASDTGSNATVTDLQKGSVVLHVAGSDNVLIKNLAIVPRTIADSVRGIVGINALTVDGINCDNDSVVAGGFSSRAYQQSTTGGNRSFDQLLQNSYWGTVSKGYHRRDALYGATIKFTTSVLKSDRYSGAYTYAYKVRNNRIHTIHTGIGSAGFTVDTLATPDDTLYPLIYIDSNTITVDTRNDLFMTYNDNDVNNSAGDPYGIGVDGVDRGSRITGNSISSMASTYYGGDGMLLQHIDATVDTPFAVYNNTFALQHGAHPRIAEGRQAVVGTYIRNYDANYFVKGLWYHHNYGYLVVDEDTATTYAGRYGECVRMGFENGANGNVIENNHFTLIPRDSLTRTGAGNLEVSGLTFEQHDSTNSAGDAGTGNNVARYNYWRVPRNPIWLGGTRIGIGADNVHIIGDTCNTIYDGDSTFVRFHQSGTYYSHSINNDLQDMVLQGYANPSDVIKGTVTASPDQWGKQLSYLRGLTVNLKDVSAVNVAGGTIWAIDNYGHRFDMPTTNGSGNSSDTLRWRFFGYDALPADGYVVADSNSYNNFTFWGKSGLDSAYTAATINWTTSPTINVQLTSSTPPTPQTYNSLKGATLKGVTIK